MDKVSTLENGTSRQCNLMDLVRSNTLINLGPSTKRVTSFLVYSAAMILMPLSKIIKLKDGSSMTSKLEFKSARRVISRKVHSKVVFRSKETRSSSQTLMIPGPQKAVKKSSANSVKTTKMKISPS